MKHLYEVDCWDADNEGALYWIAANNIRQAVEALFQCWKDEGLEGFQIDLVQEERAKKLFVKDDGLDIRDPMNEVATACIAPTVIACSEWP